MLLFTILLFLLPTTALYYLVFTLVRRTPYDTPHKEKLGCLFLTPACRCAAAPGGGAVPGRPPPQRGLHQLLPAVRFGPAHLSALQTGRYHPPL